jgi:hypothetical protein
MMDSMMWKTGALREKSETVGPSGESIELSDDFEILTESFFRGVTKSLE